MSDVNVHAVEVQEAEWIKIGVLTCHEKKENSRRSVTIVAPSAVIEKNRCQSCVSSAAQLLTRRVHQTLRRRT